MTFAGHLVGFIRRRILTSIALLAYMLLAAYLMLLMFHKSEVSDKEGILTILLFFAASIVCFFTALALACFKKGRDSLDFFIVAGIIVSVFTLVYFNAGMVDF